MSAREKVLLSVKKPYAGNDERRKPGFIMRMNSGALWRKSETRLQLLFSVIHSMGKFLR
ncbi:hypothetical protein HMPREF3038_01237 [Akkermansia sp. KLE1797]|nr:hypothetical protein HMPREF3038_01237 [Akkermansia sp. KLE1797]KXU52855.1 hypothetical protein HMPREF3039_03021 [Akkermansia sp. KLE1798]KZA04183.1 hypothetical protein HMPREF1326_02106 [Akkermansia sp. KLE1605]